MSAMRSGSEVWAEASAVFGSRSQHMSKISRRDWVKRTMSAVAVGSTPEAWSAAGLNEQADPDAAIKLCLIGASKNRT